MSDTNLPLLSTRSCHLPRNCLAWIILATCPSLEGRWCVACSYDIPLRWKGTNWKFGWTLPGLVSRLLLLLLVLDAIVSSWLLMVADGFPSTCPKKINCKKLKKTNYDNLFPCSCHFALRSFRSAHLMCFHAGHITAPEDEILIQHRADDLVGQHIAAHALGVPRCLSDLKTHLPCHALSISLHLCQFISFGRKHEKFHPSFGWTCDKDWQDKYILDTTKRVGNNVNWGFQHTHLHMERLDEFRLLTSSTI